MERGMSPGAGAASRGAQGFALPTRAAALAECRAGLEAGGGPVLVTGEAGVGKTWLARALADGTGDRRWAAVDLTPATGPADLFRAIGQALGLPIPDTLGAARQALAEDLAERAA